MSTNFRNHQHARPFLNAILDALYKKNDKLLAGLTKGTGLQNLTWLESFQPLSAGGGTCKYLGSCGPARLLADRKINRTGKETQQATHCFTSATGALSSTTATCARSTLTP